MSKVIFTVGLPASGKTSWANDYVAANPGTINANRDDIRFMLYGTYFGEPIDENVVTTVQADIIRGGFKKHKDVIVSDTNLNARSVKTLVKMANQFGVEAEFKYFDVELHELIKRDKARGRQVGENVIRDMWSRYVEKGRVPRHNAETGVFVFEKYEGTPQGADAIIVDLDGTVALHRRSPYDYNSLDTDMPNEAVIRAVRNEWYMGTTILFTSGRPDSHRQMTIDWITKHIFEGEMPTQRVRLFMRTAGDDRQDAIVKHELFNKFIRADFNVMYAFDDRNQVVDMWRDMGIACFQVNPGDF